MSHSGEEWFTFAWPDYAVLAVFIIIYLALVFGNRLPTMKSFKEFLDAINSAGGHIFLLAALSVYSIKIAMQFFYHILALPEAMFTKQESIITAGITFVQGTLVGTFLGALIKTMSGGKANSDRRAGDASPPASEPKPPAPEPADAGKILSGS